MQILVVDDDDETRDVVSRALERDGHSVILASDVATAEAALLDKTVSLIVLDVMLEASSGLTFCAKLRRDGYELPILFLSARGTTNARVEGLDAGGDDYLAKPFSLKELTARVRALARRGPSVEAVVIDIEHLRLDMNRRIATRDGVELPVTAREWEILHLLAKARGRVVGSDDLLEVVWGDATERTRASCAVILSRLRKKLDAAAGCCVIRTARGLGYALEFAR